MTRYVWHEGQWWPVSTVPPAPRRSPYIIRDHMPPLRHPCTGAILDSKSTFRAITKAAGCVELGNDAPREPASALTDAKDVRADVEQAMQMVEQGHRTPPLAPASPETRVYGEPAD